MLIVLGSPEAFSEQGCLTFLSTISLKKNKQETPFIAEAFSQKFQGTVKVSSMFNKM